MPKTTHPPNPTDPTPRRWNPDGKGARPVPEQYRDFMTKKRRQMFQTLASSLVAGRWPLPAALWTAQLLPWPSTQGHDPRFLFPAPSLPPPGYVVSNVAIFIKQGFELQTEALYATGQSLLICTVISLVIILMA